MVFLRQQLKDTGKLYGDLKRFRAMENPPSTVPIDILPTKAAIWNLLDEAGKTAITVPQRIFMARNEEIWNSPQLLP